MPPWQRGVGAGPFDPGIPGAPGVPGVPGFPRAPTAWDILHGTRNGPTAGPWGPNVPPGNFGQVPQIPPDVLKNLQVPQVTIPKFDLSVPSVRPPSPSKGPRVPSWVRWEWAVGVFVVSLVGGMASGYWRRRQSRG